MHVNKRIAPRTSHCSPQYHHHMNFSAPLRRFRTHLKYGRPKVIHRKSAGTVVCQKLPQVLGIIPIQTVHLILRVVRQGHVTYNAVNVNPLAISMVILEFVPSNVFAIILQHNLYVWILICSPTSVLQTQPQRRVGFIG